MLEEGVIPPFYLDKIRDDQGTRAVSALTMSILFSNFNSIETTRYTHV